MIEAEDRGIYSEHGGRAMSYGGHPVSLEAGKGLSLGPPEGTSSANNMILAP